MPITLNCPCGKLLRVADEHAGRRVKCPACGAVIEPPAPEPVLEIVEEPPPGKPKPAAKPSAADKDEEYDGSTYTLLPDDGRRSGPSRSDEDEEEEADEDGGGLRGKQLPNFRKGTVRTS